MVACNQQHGEEEKREASGQNRRPFCASDHRIGVDDEPLLRVAKEWHAEQIFAVEVGEVGLDFGRNPLPIFLLAIIQIERHARRQPVRIDPQAARSRHFAVRLWDLGANATWQRRFERSALIEQIAHILAKRKAVHVKRVARQRHAAARVKRNGARLLLFNIGHRVEPNERVAVGRDLIADVADLFPFGCRAAPHIRATVYNLHLDPRVGVKASILPQRHPNNIGFCIGRAA